MMTVVVFEDELLRVLCEYILHSSNALEEIEHFTRSQTD